MALPGDVYKTLHPGGGYNTTIPGRARFVPIERGSPRRRSRKRRKAVPRGDRP